QAERLLQRRGEGRDGGERMRELALIELQQLGGGRGGAEAADGAGVVPVTVMRAAHQGADARRDLVADDHGTQEVRPLEAERVRRGDGGSAGVIDAVAVDVVDFYRVCGAAMD